MRKPVKNIIIILITALAFIYLFNKMNVLPKLNNLFSEKPVIVAETPILIEEIKSIAQLVTITSFDEVVVDSTVSRSSSAVINSINNIVPVPIIPIVDKRIVLIVKGKVLAGTNLQQLHADDIAINNDTVYISLPKSVVLDAIINPSDFETFDEQGSWPDDAVRLVKIKARDKIIERALQHNILAKADARAKEIIKGFVLNAGYKFVTVETKQ
jgi:hypothetical protein